MTALAAVGASAHRSVAQSWNRLWAHQPSLERDDELLLREKASKRWRMIRDRLRRTFGRIKGLRTIEMGCGRGDLSALLAQEGACVTLLDTSQRALDQARMRFSRLGLEARFEIGDLFAINSALDRYDVSLSSGVIEHFQSDQRTLAIQRHGHAIHDHGMAIISVPNARCVPYRIWKSWLELRDCWPYGYECPFSRRELRRRARQAGFDRIEIRGFGFGQSLTDQLMPLFRRRPVRKAAPDSMLDESMGLALILFGWTT